MDDPDHAASIGLALEAEELPNASQIDADGDPARDELVPLLTRSGRQRKIPKRHADFIPTSLKEIPSHIRRVYEERKKKSRPPPPIPAAILQAQEDVPPPNDPAVDLESFEEEVEEPIFYNTEPNRFGVFRQYTVFPQVDPEANRAMDDFVDSPRLQKSPADLKKTGTCSALRGIGKNVARGIKDNLFTPLKNSTVFLLMSWFYNGSTTKTATDYDILVNDVFKHPLFHLEDLDEPFQTSKELHSLDNYDPTQEVLTPEDGWQAASVKIAVPKDGQKYTSEDQAHHFTVDGLHHRKLLSVVKEAFEDPSAKTFHFTPHKLFWNPPPVSAPDSLSSPSPLAPTSSSSNLASSLPRRKVTVEDVADEYDLRNLSDENTTQASNSNNQPKPERIYSEIYNSDTMIEEHAKINSQPREPGDPLDLEYVSTLR